MEDNAHLADVAFFAVQAEGAIELRSHHDAGPHVTHVGVTRGAIATVPVGGNKAEDDMIAYLAVGDSGTHLLNNAGPFMPSASGR